MESPYNLTQAMNSITLEDEEEGGISFEETEVADVTEVLQGFDYRLCLVGRFVNEGVIDFLAMQHTLASLWRPGKGVCVK